MDAFVSSTLVHRKVVCPFSILQPLRKLHKLCPSTFFFCPFVFQIKILFFLSSIFYVFCSFSSFCLFSAAGLAMHIIFCHSRCNQMVFYCLFILGVFLWKSVPFPCGKCRGEGGQLIWFFHFIPIIINGRLLQIFFCKCSPPRPAKPEGLEGCGRWSHNCNMAPPVHICTSAHKDNTSQVQRFFKPSKSLQVGIR